MEQSKDCTDGFFSYGKAGCCRSIARPLFLAPLAGATERAFRSACARLGSAQGVTELVSARGIRYSGLGASMHYLEIDPSTEGPVSIQLFGFDPEDFRFACAAILEDPRLSQLTALDINMGCPVPKVVKTGAGSALMCEPERAVEIVKACRAIMEPAGVPVTCKFRKGFSANENTALNFALKMAEAGVSLLCLHARTRAQMYSGEADHNVTREVHEGLIKAGYHIPLIANGDIDTVAKARQILEEKICEGLMIGRAAMQNPFLFRQLAWQLWPETCPEAWSKVDWIQDERLPVPFALRVSLMREVYEGLCLRRGEDLASRECRSLMLKLMGGFPQAARLRKAASELKDRAAWISFFCDLSQTFGAGAGGEI